MKKYLYKRFIYLFLLLNLTSCKVQQLKVSYDSYKISNNNTESSKINDLLKPYKDSLSSIMNEVIGFSINGLTKKQPESVLGNFMTDAFKKMVEEKFKKNIDAAFVNFGGIRSYIPKGDVTIGKMFELMPFENTIVLQKLTGSQLKLFLNKVCEKGGWPVSVGLTYSIKDKKLFEVFVNEKKVVDDEIYTIANSDYIAGGGDNCDMLKALPKENLNYLMREALIDYTKKLTKENKTVDAKTENRVVYAK